MTLGYDARTKMQVILAQSLHAVVTRSVHAIAT